MLFLIALLITAFGMLAKGFIEYLFRKDSKNTSKNKGESSMQSSSWMKISLFSLAGIIISLIILSLLNTKGLNGSNSLNAYSGTAVNSALQTSTTNGTADFGSYQGLNSSSSNTFQSNDNNSIVNNLNQLQQQINQIQSQMSQLQISLQNQGVPMNSTGY
jgi:hypothetical protein